MATGVLARPREVVITPALFAIPFSIAGLAGTWRVTGPHWTTVVADLLAAASAALTVALAIPWVTRLVDRELDLLAELRDPLLGPSVPAIAIAAMLVSTTLLGRADLIGRALLAIFAVLTLASGLAVVTAWLVNRLPLRSYHPGFYLPTAGGALLTAQCVTGLGWIGLAQVLFVAGLVSWAVLGVATSLRLRTTPLPPALRPVVTIEIAAPALAGNTYLVVFGRYDGYALALGAITVLMGVVQLALIPYYRRAPFGPGFWTAGFSYATTAALALRWINHEHPAGATLWQALALALSTGVVVLLSGATVLAARHGRFLPTRKLAIEDPAAVAARMGA